LDILPQGKRYNEIIALGEMNGNFNA